jgi:hypothetical protein
MDFTDLCATALALDAHKRVLYTHGLVLGVGEFRAEQHYFLEKHRSHNRSLHGYGTVAGLAVSVRDTANGPEVRVSAGLAIDPHGREICVPEPQCARLNDWLLQRRGAGELSPPLDGSPPGVTAYVVLCYRECEVDKVPIPVGPCHSLDKTSVASRIQDAFELRLLEAPPAQAEEDALRALGDLLSRVRVGTGLGALTTPDALVAAVRDLAPEISPPGAPPPGPVVLLHPQFAEGILRTALRVFVTEVRPLLVPEGGGCLNGPRDQTCVLLAQLDFDVQEVGGVPQVSGPVQVSEQDRPLLLQSGLLQEAWLSSAARAATTTIIPPSQPPLGPGLAPAPAAARGAPAFAGAERTLMLAPGQASPIGEAVTAAALNEAIPALRFQRGGAVAFTFSPPPDLAPGMPVRVRLHWAFQRTTASAASLTWRAALRALSAGEDLSEAGPGASFPVRGEAPDRGRLLVTDFAELSFPARAQPSLLSLKVSMDTSAAVERNSEIYLLAAELAYATGG